MSKGIKRNDEGDRMSLSGTLFLLLVGLLIFGPAKLSQVGKQLGVRLAKLRSVTADFRSQLQIEMEEARKEEAIAQVSLLQATAPTETSSSILESRTEPSEGRRGDASHG